MYACNPFALDFGDNDDDGDMLVMNLSSLHMRSINIGVDPSWISRNVHVDLVKIVNKFNDPSWLSRNQHEYCIFYAVDIIGELASLSEDACNAVLNVPGAVDSLLCLWRRDLTWFEQRVTARTLTNIFKEVPNVISKFIDNDHIPNIVAFAVKQYTECMQKVIKRCMIVPDQFPDGYVEDLVLKVQGQRDLVESTRNCIISWQASVGAICVHFAKFSESNKMMLSLWETLKYEDFEKAVSMDLCYTLFDGKGISDPHTSTFMDALIDLTKNKGIRRVIMERENIIKALILKLRARDTMHLRYDLIVLNLLRHNVIPTKFHYDLCVSLMSLLNASRLKYAPDIYIQYNKLLLFDTCVESLKLLFGIGPFEYVESGKSIDTLKCRKCHKLMNLPYKIPCGHRYCFHCISAQRSKKGTAKQECFVRKCKSKLFTFGKDEKFDFKVANQLNALQIRSTLRNREFVGSLSEYWPFIKRVFDRTDIVELGMNQEFNAFCDFMIKETSLKTSKECKEKRLFARSKRGQGSVHFKAGRYEDAISCYVEALKVCPHKYEDDRIATMSNLAIALSKMDLWRKAYIVALSGLTLNRFHLELSNILSQCHSKLSLSDITRNLIDDDIATNPIIRKVHWVNLYQYATNAKYQYFNQKKTEIEALSDVQQKEEIQRKVQESVRKSRFFQRQTAIQREALKHGIAFIWCQLTKYKEEYKELKEQRKFARNDIHEFIISVLSERGSLENEEYVVIDDLMEMIRDRFALESRLENLYALQRRELIALFISTQCVETDDTENDGCEVPAIIMKAVNGYIFSKYNAYAIDEWAIWSIAEKSKYLERSKESLKSDSCSSKYYGVRLVDDDVDDTVVNDQEFSDNDSIFGEFISHEM